jgi:hypothetical protein
METVINDRQFLIDKMSAKTQLLVGKRLLPLLMGIDDNAIESEKLKQFFVGFQSMPDDDLLFVIDACLNVTSFRKTNADPWARLTANGSGGFDGLMLSSLDMADILQLVQKALEVNFGDFLASSVPNSTGTQATS